MSDPRPESFWRFAVRMLAWLLFAAMVCATVIVGISVYSSAFARAEIIRAETVPKHEAVKAIALADQLKYSAIIQNQELEKLRMQIEIDNRKRNIGAAKSKPAQKPKPKAAKNERQTG
jgi:hypothetical protein